MINHLSLQGRLVEDARVGQTNSGTDYANFRLAWSKKYKDKESKCFIECKAFGNTAKFIGQYMSQKGQEILVEGELNTEEWTSQDGQKRSKLAVIVDRVHFCGSKKDSGQDADANKPVPQPVEVETDELPF